MKYIASISGGQDSTAMTVRLLELGEPVDYIVFLDTGNEFPQMYAYLAKLDEWLRRKYGIGISRLSSGKTLEDLVFSPFRIGDRKGQIRGMPYASSMSYCTRDLKKNVAARFSKAVGGATLYIGYVYHEQNRMHEQPEPYIEHRYPLIEWGWNEPDVNLYLREMGLYNTLYDHFLRTGCMFCPKQSVDSWYALYANFPERWDEAKQWERRAAQMNAHIVTFRSDWSLEEKEKEFSERLRIERQTPQFQFDWEEEKVSCFCK